MNSTNCSNPGYNPQAPLGPPRLERNPFIGCVSIIKKKILWPIGIGGQHTYIVVCGSKPFLDRPSATLHAYNTEVWIYTPGFICYIYMFYMYVILIWSFHVQTIQVQARPLFSGMHKNIAYSIPTFFTCISSFRQLNGIPSGMPKIIIVPIPALFL